MSKLTRKNLMVDAEALRALAHVRGTSESQAVRDAVEKDLGLQEMAQAMEALADLVEKEGAFSDFEELFPPVDDDGSDVLGPAESVRGA